jgi:hypothetical protein
VRTEGSAKLKSQGVTIKLEVKISETNVLLIMIYTFLFDLHSLTVLHSFDGTALIVMFQVKLHAILETIGF